MKQWIDESMQQRGIESTNQQIAINEIYSCVD